MESRAQQEPMLRLPHLEIMRVVYEHADFYFI